MTNSTTNPTVPGAKSISTPPELLVSAVLHLMSHYSAQSQDNGPCIKLAAVIERHLKALSELPDLAPVLRATCLQLCEQWAGVVERAARPVNRASLFGRLVASNRTH